LIENYVSNIDTGEVKQEAEALESTFSTEDSENNIVSQPMGEYTETMQIL
jgi:hypothetical protein